MDVLGTPAPGEPCFHSTVGGSLAGGHLLWLLHPTSLVLEPAFLGIFPKLNRFFFSPKGTLTQEGPDVISSTHSLWLCVPEPQALREAPNLQEVPAALGVLTCG